MSPNVRPHGPLPARVYWTRRLVVLAIPLVLVITLAKLLGGSADGKDETPTATQAGARTTESTQPRVPLGPTVPAEAKKRRKKKQKPAEPVLAEPSGPCANEDIVATPTITQAPGGSDVPVTLNLRTVDAEACTWQVSPESLTLTITSGKDHIWSSRECPAAVPVQDVVLRSAVDTPVTVTWNAKRSDETCSRFTEWAMPGWYHVEAAALAGEPTDVQFELVRPTSAVITKTVTPKPEKQKKRKGQQDRGHTPGEDGAGNSEG